MCRISFSSPQASDLGRDIRSQPRFESVGDGLAEHGSVVECEPTSYIITSRRDERRRSETVRRSGASIQPDSRVLRTDTCTVRASGSSVALPTFVTACELDVLVPAPPGTTPAVP